MADGEALRVRLDKEEEYRKENDKAPALDVMLVFAPGNLACGRLMDFIKPALSTHPVIHIYLKK